MPPLVAAAIVLASGFHAPRRGRTAELREPASFTESAASITNRIADLGTFQLINTGSGAVEGFGEATVVVGITQDRSVRPCGPGSWMNAATRRIVLTEGVLGLRELAIRCPTGSGPDIMGTYEVDGLASTGIFAGARSSGESTVEYRHPYVDALREAEARRLND